MMNNMDMSIAYVEQVFMPLFECVDEHRLLLVTDLSRRMFLVFDSLVTKRARARTDLVNSVVSALSLLQLTDTYAQPYQSMSHFPQKNAIAAALSRTPEYSDACSWGTKRPPCPQQEK